MTRFTMVALFTFCLLFQLTAQQSWQGKQEKLIRERIDRFVQDINTANAEGFVDAFSDKLYSQASKESIKASVAEREKVYDIDYSIHLNDVKVDNKMAYEEGWFRSELTPKNGGQPVIQEFDFLDVWELEGDGKWRITKAFKKERTLSEYKDQTALSGEPSQIVGSYETEKFPVDVKVTTSDQLVLIVNNGSPIKLTKTRSLTYNLEGLAGAELRFDIGNDGLANKAILNQATGEVVAQRIK